MVNIKKLPNPELIRKLYQKYYIQEFTSTSLMSSHWQEFTKYIKVDFDMESGILNEFKGYGFGDLQHTRLIDKILNYFCNLSYFIRLPYKRDIKFLVKKAIPLLQKIDSYLSYDCFRQICSLVVIRKYFDLREKDYFNILVIGDGYGFLSALLKSLYINATITLVDIGKVLLFQAVNLQRIYPDFSHFLFDDQKTHSNNFDFLYIPAECMPKMMNIKYKLIINISSMQEMNYETINDYFTFLRSNSTKDNLFYCCNRRLKILPRGEVIEFFKYPWHSKDKHIVDEEPLFYRYFLSPRFPFIHYFEGCMHHRLTNLFLERD